MARGAKSRRRSNDSEEVLSRTVRFMKIVIAESLEAKKLMLPWSFTRNYWRKKAPSLVILTLPGNEKWEMKTFKDGLHQVWLQTGFEAFADFYRLVHGCSLHFAYRGGSKFKVRVYSEDCLEIKYPLSVPDSSSSCPSLEADEDDPMEDSDYTEEAETTEEQDDDDDDDDDEDYAELPRSGREKITTEDSFSSQEEEEISEQEESDEDFDELPKKSPVKRGKSQGKPVLGRGKELPHFVKTIKAAYLKFYQAHIPGEFSMKYIAESSDCVKLKIGNKVWNVNLNRHGAKFRYPKLSKGWKQFARDNHLEVGDKCMFQLLKTGPVLVFEVTIIRVRS